MKNGVPWDIAFPGWRDLDDAEIKGLAIMFSQFEGSEFDIHTMSFKKPQGQR